VVHVDSWSPPPLFRVLAAESGLSDSDLYETLNMGIGMIVVVPAESLDQVLGDAGVQSVAGFVCGEIIGGDGSVRLSRAE